VKDFPITNKDIAMAYINAAIKEFKTLSVVGSGFKQPYRVSPALNITDSFIIAYNSTPSV